MGRPIRVVAGMATMPGREKSSRLAYMSLKDQVDDLWVYDNGVFEDLTDNGKFFFLKDYDEPIYYFSCDDDIIYPPDYVNRTLQAIDKYNCIVTYHGRILRGLDRRYYSEHSALSCLHSFMQNIELDVAGTGVCAFRTDYFNPTEIWNSPDKKMSDLVFSLEAAKQGKKIMHIGHKAKWIQEINNEQTIYGTVSKDEEKLKRLTEITNEIYRIKKLTKFD